MRRRGSPPSATRRRSRRSPAPRSRRSPSIRERGHCHSDAGDQASGQAGGAGAGPCRAVTRSRGPPQPAHGAAVKRSVGFVGATPETGPGTAGSVLALALQEGLLCPFAGGVSGAAHHGLRPVWQCHVQPMLESMSARAQRPCAYYAVPGAQTCVYEAVRTSLGSPAERLLWHGTSWQSLPNILRSGFNRAYCGKHGTRFGVGTYFATEPEYALRFCDREAPSALLLASVLVGRYTRGVPGLVEPPLLNDQEPKAHRGDIRSAASVRRYDSTVDCCHAPRVFCVFRDFQALPVGLVILD